MPKVTANPDNEHRISCAIEAYRQGLYRSPEASAKAHNLRPQTLRDRLSGRTQAAGTAHKDQQRISPAGEAALERHCLFLANAGFPCRISTIRALAAQILMEERPSETRPLGKIWHTNFLGRHPELKMVYARSIALERAIANNNPLAIENFFTEYARAKSDYNVQDPDIWNMDETGFMMGFAFAAKVIAMKGRRVVLKTVPGNREWCSSIDAISMGGEVLDPFIIFRGKELTVDLAKDIRKHLPTTTIAMSDNGWSNSEKGLAWLKIFEEQSRRPETWVREERAAQEAVPDPGEKPCSSGYRMLIMDGHSSHVNVEFVRFCWDHRIIPVCLPPHSTHILQPLDLVIFRRLKQAYSDKVDEYSRNGWTGIDKRVFVWIFGKIRDEVYSRDRILAAFRAAGLSPFDPEIPKARCVKRPRTPEPENQVSLPILSSPLNPPTPRDNHTLARFGKTMADSTVSNAAKLVVSQKLIDFTGELRHTNTLLEKQNDDLLKNAEERRKKRSSKRDVLERHATVLTNKLLDDRLNAKDAAEQAKVDAKRNRESDKDARARIRVQKQVEIEERKSAREHAKQLKIAKDLLQKEEREASKEVRQLRKALEKEQRKNQQNPTPETHVAYMLAHDQFTVANTRAEQLQEQCADSVAQHAKAQEEVKRLNQTSQEPSAMGQSKLQQGGKAQEVVDADADMDVDVDADGSSHSEFGDGEVDSDDIFEPYGPTEEDMELDGGYW